LDTTDFSIIAKFIFVGIDDIVLYKKVVIFSLPFYWLIYRFYFENWHDFVDSIKYFFQPWFVSQSVGKTYDDYWQTFKLMIFLLSCLAMSICNYKLTVYSIETQLLKTCLVWLDKFI